MEGPYTEDEANAVASLARAWGALDESTYAEARAHAVNITSEPFVAAWEVSKDPTGEVNVEGYRLPVPIHTCSGCGAALYSAAPPSGSDQGHPLWFCGGCGGCGLTRGSLLRQMYEAARSTRLLLSTTHR